MKYVNLTTTHSDTPIALNRGLTTNENGLRGMYDTSLQSSIDSRQMVKTLCCSCKNHKWSHFASFTCNKIIILDYLI